MVDPIFDPLIEMARAQNLRRLIFLSVRSSNYKRTESAYVGETGRKSTNRFTLLFVFRSLHRQYLSVVVVVTLLPAWSLLRVAHRCCGLTRQPTACGTKLQLHEINQLNEPWKIDVQPERFINMFEHSALNCRTTNRRRVS